MNPRRTLSILAATLALTGCAQYATVTEIKPPRRSGIEVGSRDPVTAVAGYVEAAEKAWRRLDVNPSDLEARRDYNFAVARICGTLRSAKLEPWRAPIRLGSRTLAWRRDPRPEWNPARYELIPADQLKLKGSYVEDREIKDGLGAPLVAKRIADQAHELAPTPHFYYGVTAVARFEGTRCVLAFEDPLARETVTVGRRTFPLAADFTAPLAMMLVEMHPKGLEVPRLLHPEKYAATTRIARLEPFDPDKTVVLMIHGLMDSPATWFPLLNHLRADEEIRRKFQFWFFSYPSGYPYPYSAELLRRELDHAEKLYPSRRKLVVIGHSMGGCISRLLITNAGRRVWDEMFTVPPEKLPVPETHRHIITEATIFEHRPEIGRVIFISAPHRGSDLATISLGRVASKLIQAPKNLLMLGTEIAQFEKHPVGDLHLDRFPDSVDTLAPNNDFVLAIGKVPVASGIPHHTIVGDRGRGDSPKSSDGVVPYWSSHMPDAHSEKVVPSHHSAHQHPETVAEVKRILFLHTK